MDGHRFATEASTGIAVQSDEKNQLIPCDVQRNRLFAQQLPSSNSVATLDRSRHARIAGPLESEETVELTRRRQTGRSAPPVVVASR